MNNKYNELNNFQNNSIFIYENFILALRKIKEYKFNCFLELIGQIIYLGSFLILYLTIINNFNILDLKPLEFLFYILLIDLFVSFLGIIEWKYPLRKQIILGTLNEFLTRPKNIFLMWVFTYQNERALIQFLVNLIGIIILSFFIDFKFSFMFFLIYFLVSILYYLIRVFSNSVNFFSFGLASFLYTNFFSKVSTMFKIYTSGYFKKLKYQFLLFIFPLFYFGEMYLEILKLGVFTNYSLVFYLIFTIFIFSFSIFLLWKYGLKRYEAFN